MSSAKEDDLQTLKDWIKKQPHLPSLPDEQLMLFLHSCYYSTERAKQAIDVCFTVRTHSPEIFEDRNPKNPDVQAFFDVVFINKLPKRDKKDQVVLLTGLKEFDASKFFFESTLKTAMLCTELIIKEHPTAEGFVVVIDTKGISLSHLPRININTLKKFLIYVQEGLPFRMRAVHFINVTPIMDRLIQLMKPFLSDELSNMFSFHKGDNETLYKEYDKSFMPKDYGGKEKTVAELNAEIKDMMINGVRYVEEEAQWRVDEKKRTGKLKTRIDLFGVEGSFKKLDID